MSEKEDATWIDAVRQMADETRGHTPRRKRRKARREWTSLTVTDKNMRRIYAIREELSERKDYRLSLSDTVGAILDIAEGELGL